MNYYGGKWNLAPWIISHFPPHDVYVEAFGGALSVFMQKDPVRLEVVNDKDLQIATLYSHLRHAANHLAILLELTPYSRHEYYSSKSRDLGSLDDSRKTIAASYMGVGNSLADAKNGFRNSKVSNTTPSKSFRTYLAEFESFHDRIGNAIVECLDYPDLFEKYDGPETLWYLDPPYVWNTRADQQADRAYSEEMSDADHAKLLRYVMNLRGMVLLSGYDSEIYRSLPWRRVTTEGRTQRNGVRTEVLWMNPAAERAQSQLMLFDEVKRKPRCEACRRNDEAWKEHLACDDFRARQIIQWIREGTKPAMFAFTDGNARQIAYAVESLFGEGHLSTEWRKRVARMKKRYLAKRRAEGK